MSFFFGGGGGVDGAFLLILSAVQAMYNFFIYFGIVHFPSEPLALQVKPKLKSCYPDTFVDLSLKK